MRTRTLILLIFTAFATAARAEIRPCPDTFETQTIRQMREIK